MNVSILKVLRKGSQNFGPEGVQWLFNNASLSFPVRNTDTITAVMFTADPRPPSSLEKYILQGELQTIKQTIGSNYNGGATISLTPNKIGTLTNTSAQLVNVDNIRYGRNDGGNCILKVLRPGKMDLETWTFNSTTIMSLAETINQAVTNQLFGVIWGACSTSTQAITYQSNLSGTMYLEVNDGDGFVPIDSFAVTGSISSQTHTFSFTPGDLILGDTARVSLKVGTSYYPIAVTSFACAGGTGSGSGAPGDCNGYAYFDGHQYDNTLKTLNWGATCTDGYVLQISTTNLFTTLVTDITTEAKIWTVDYLANGTYYARVKNVHSQTRFSPTLTFTKS